MIGSQGQLMVLEFNCRMGDPETQPILMRLKSDLVEALMAATDTDPANFGKLELDWDRRFALGVVLAAANYPNTPRKGDAIQGLPADQGDVMVFHAATQLAEKQILTHGGRVLCVTALGDTVRQAQVHAYETVDAIHFDGMQYRRDIGHRAVRK
jgi:phosphoribosylamine--glycine ligase